MKVNFFLHDPMLVYVNSEKESIEMFGDDESLTEISSEDVELIEEYQKNLGKILETSDYLYKKYY